MLDLDPDRAVTPNAEAAYCPTCELRHTRRPDWLCPRCGMPVETDAPDRKTVRAQPAERKFPVGSRVAGAIMAVSCGALASALARDPAGEHRWPLLAAAVVLAALAPALLVKVSVARWIAVVAALVVAVVVSEGVIRDRLPELIRDPLPEPLRHHLRDLLRALQPAKVLLLVAFAVGCLVLLVGRPRRARIAAGVLLTAPLVVLEIMLALGR